MVYRPKYPKKNQNMKFRPNDKSSNPSRQIPDTKIETMINQDSAKAPYNFVPLNKSVIEAEKLPDQDCYYSDRNTGHLDCTLETLTPIYVRDTLTQDELEQKEAIEKDGKKRYINSDFFSPGKRFRIPGSSLRGMIRNLIEIASYGKFVSFEDKRLFFRAVADTSSLGQAYKNVMVDEANNYFPKIKAGILKKVNRSYVIYPSKNLPEGSNSIQIYRINFDKKSKIVEGTNFKLSNFEFRDIYFQPVPLQDHTHARWDRRKNANVPYKLRYAKLASVNDIKDKNHPTKGYIIASGEFGNKKHMHWVINEPGTESIKIDENVIEEYRNDSSRNGPDLLEKWKEYPSGVPCFYITDGNRITSFGHTGMFRLAYKLTIGEHIPKELWDESKTDFVEAIFGKAAEKDKKSFSGRVFFEDALLLNQNENPIMDELIPKTLSSPKPTTFQHYLKQDESNNIKNLKHYNDPDANIRGYKLYWHKSGENWTQNDFNPKQDTKIRPVKPNTKFNFRIRFENLSQIELGALLFALKLPDRCAHKLGMGKPLGLGSVKIKPELSISDRKKRYSSLFENEAWTLSENINSEAEIDRMINIFQKHILGKIGAENENPSSLWETSRLKKLKLLLDVEIGKKLEKEGKIRYMSIEPKNEFKDRNVLPSPEEVIPL
ncbi:MAG: TIGR03986 family CRISPR-associated RAMP protein [Candidatus Methanoperedens sp.]